MTAARRLAAHLRTPVPQGYFPGVVLAVTTGAAGDGSALVTVSWNGVDSDLPYLASYSPAVGHVVLVTVTSGGQAVILGRLVGTPPS